MPAVGYDSEACAMLKTQDLKPKLYLSWQSYSINRPQPIYFTPFLSYDHISTFVTRKAAGGKCHEVSWVYKSALMQREAQQLDSLRFTDKFS